MAKRTVSEQPLRVSKRLRASSHSLPTEEPAGVSAENALSPLTVQSDDDVADGNGSNSSESHHQMELMPAAVITSAPVAITGGAIAATGRGEPPVFVDMNISSAGDASLATEGLASDANTTRADEGMNVTDVEGANSTSADEGMNVTGAEAAATVTVSMGVQTSNDAASTHDAGAAVETGGMPATITATQGPAAGATNTGVTNDAADANTHGAVNANTHIAADANVDITGDPPNDQPADGNTNDAVGDNTNGEVPEGGPVIPNNATAIISASGVQYSAELMQRLNAMVSFSDHANGRFAIGTVPPTAAWGSGTADSTFCIADVPVNIFMVGEIRTTWFHTRLGNPQRYVNLRIRPVRASDLNAAKSLLATHATMPPPNSKYRNVVYAGCRSTKQMKGSPQATAVEFTKCYDARTQFRTKTAMDKWPVSMIGFNDLVLLECYMTRYRVDNDGNIVYKGAWANYRTAYELQALSLLAIGPDTFIDEEDNEVEADGNVVL
ncbi:hypothetical protein B0H21DRAFT_712407 [Amylocystis lapponica]|nr:hypothetical protein B0H21DRAFT_712407 [Amylocystis lapponica]